MPETRHKPLFYYWKRWALLTTTPLYIVLSIIYMALDINSEVIELLGYHFILLLVFLICQLFGFLAAYRECFRYSYLYAFCSLICLVVNIFLTVFYYSEDYKWWPFMVTLMAVSALLCALGLWWARDLYVIRNSSQSSTQAFVR